MIMAPTMLLAQLDGTGNAPDFTLVDIDGNEHQLYDYLDDNKIVVLDFFAVWCSICKADAEYLEAVYDSYGPDGSNQIEMLSLEADNVSTDDQTRAFAAEFGGGNPHINTTDEVPDLYALKGFPTYYVIAPDRSYYVIGGRQETMQIEMVEAILDSPPLRTVENDARVVSFSSPIGSICNEVFYPDIRIQNYGKNEIAGLKIETLIDGVIESIHLDEEVLNAYQFRDYMLPKVDDLDKGWHEIEFRFREINGTNDGDPDNGIKGGDFLILPGGDQVGIYLTTDSYPKETSWKIFQEGKVVASSKGYSKGLTEHLQDVCVEAGYCYQLVVYDQYGDGMSSGGIAVNYQGDIISRMEAQEFSSDSLAINFCVWPASVEKLENSSNWQFAVYPNPGSGDFKLRWAENSSETTQIMVLDVMGKALLSKSIRQGQSYTEINLSDSPNGIYFVRLITSSGQNIRRIIVKH